MEPGGNPAGWRRWLAFERKQPASSVNHCQRGGFGRGRRCLGSDGSRCGCAWRGGRQLIFASYEFALAMRARHSAAKVLHADSQISAADRAALIEIGHGRHLLGILHSYAVLMAFPRGATPEGHFREERVPLQLAAGVFNALVMIVVDASGRFMVIDITARNWFAAARVARSGRSGVPQELLPGDDRGPVLK